MNDLPDAFEQLIFGTCIEYQSWQDNFLRRKGRVPNFDEEENWVKRTKNKWSKFFEVKEIVNDKKH